MLWPRLLQKRTDILAHSLVRFTVLPGARAQVPGAGSFIHVVNLYHNDTGKGESVDGAVSSTVPRTVYVQYNRHPTTTTAV